MGTQRTTWWIKLGALGYDRDTEITASFRDNRFDTTIQVAASSAASAVLTASGHLFTFGTLDYGILGHSGNHTIPHAVLNGVKSVVSGNDHIIVLMNNGNVQGVGANYAGQLGLGYTTHYQSSFTRIMSSCGGDPVMDVFAGTHSSAAIGGNRYVCVWGSNLSFQLQSIDVDVIDPIHYTYSSGVSKVSIGSNHLLVLRSDGTVRSRGSNNLGQLGDGSFSSTTSWKTVQTPGTFWGTNNLGNVVDIAAGASFSIALQKHSDGYRLFSWGANGLGQLLSGDLEHSNIAVSRVNFGSRPLAIETARSAVLILRADGVVRGGGSNYFGVLGSTTTSTSIMSPGISGLSSISCNARHCLGIQESGSSEKAIAWGRETEGCFGKGTTSVVNHISAQDDVGCVVL
ncbi:hypothetical protein GEMRC1_003278 [Eukaryota sp. GEM-RC1]